MNPKGMVDTVQITGRSSSHYTRVVRIFAHELGVPVDLVPIFKMTRTDSAAYDHNPALKMPTMRRGDSLLFGTENICRSLAELAQTGKRIVWPEQLRTDLARNAQELVWHGMAAQVQWIMGTVVAKLPADNAYFAKGRAGFQGALGWLEQNLDDVLRLFPVDRDLSLFEVCLFCLIDHITWLDTLPMAFHNGLLQFRSNFAQRPSAQSTPYQSDRTGRPDMP